MSSSGKSKELPAHPLEWATLVVCSLIALWLASLDVAILVGAPLLNDLSGHVVAVEHLAREALPRGRIHGWSHEWFGGYPSFYFYFPVPALLVAALGSALSISKAASIVAAVAPMTLLWASWFFLKGWGVGRAGRTGAIVAVTSFLLSTNQASYGGNLAASAIGEYSYAVALSIALVYLGLLARSGRRGTAPSPFLILLVAAMAMSHAVITLLTVPASLAFAAHRHLRIPLLQHWGVAFLLTAFWAFPFLFRAHYMGWVEWVHTPFLQEIAPVQFWVLSPWLAWGLLARVGATSLRRPLSIAFFSGIAIYLIPHGLFAPGRTLPLAYLAGHLLIGLTVGEAIARGMARGSRPLVASGALGVMVLATLGALQAGAIRDFTTRMYSAVAAEIGPLQSLADALRQLPPGRLHWEAREASSPLGGSPALSLIPRLAPGWQVSGGLLRESSISYPAMQQVFYDAASSDTLRPPHNRLLRERTPSARLDPRLLEATGVTHHVTFTEEGRQWAEDHAPALLPVARTVDWTLWSLPGTRMAVALEAPPVVVSDVRWEEAVGHWLDRQGGGAAVVVDGRWRFLEPRDPRSTLASIPTAQVSFAPRTVRILTEAVGVPHLVRVSYFPNWQAYGAEGPFLAVPGFMVVIPTESVVVLRFEPTWVERAGMALSLVGLLAFLLVLRLDRRTRSPAGLQASSA